MLAGSAHFENLSRSGWHRRRTELLDRVHTELVRLHGVQAVAVCRYAGAARFRALDERVWMRFDIDDWYRELLTWMRAERGREALEIQSDCSNELYLNALTALHLRRYGRARDFPLWWVRCEWAKVDISFGMAKEQFQNWNAAWNNGKTGDIGQIEGKVLYWHHSKSACCFKLCDLRRELDDRRKKDVGHREWQLYFGLVWMVSFEPPQHDDASLASLHGERASRHGWAELFAESGLVVHDAPMERPESAVFDHVTTLDMKSLWPRTDVGTASLWVTLIELA